MFLRSKKDKLVISRELQKNCRVCWRIQETGEKTVQQNVIDKRYAMLVSGEVGEVNCHLCEDSIVNQAGSEVSGAIDRYSQYHSQKKLRSNLAVFR